MLFLLFQLGPDRYALPAERVVEVVPLLELKRLPEAPKGVAGIFNYRGRPVAAIDLCALTLDRPASERLSTRIIIVKYSDARGANHLLGLVAEQATKIMRKDAKDFVPLDTKLGAPPYLGPILTDGDGMIQLLHEQRLLSERACELLFSEGANHEGN